MRVKDDINLKDTALFDHLCKYKYEIIATKKLEMIKSAPLIVDSSLDFFKKETSYVKTKSQKGEENTDPNGLNVRVVANTTNWADSYIDVLTNGAYDETVKNDKNRMVQIHDHIHRISAKIANVKDVKVENISLKDLGLNMFGEVESLVFYNELRREYNEQIFKMYEANGVNQHSIGFRYLELELAIKNPEYKEEFETWEKYYSSIINKSIVDDRGYFWAVPKIKVYENSSVLFGANELTPTLSISTIKGINLEEQEEKLENQEQKQNKKRFYY